jgi:hypothetical protein
LRNIVAVVQNGRFGNVFCDNFQIQFRIVVQHMADNTASQTTTLSGLVGIPDGAREMVGAIVSVDDMGDRAGDVLGSLVGRRRTAICKIATPPVVSDAAVSPIDAVVVVVIMASPSTPLLTVVLVAKAAETVSWLELWLLLIGDDNAATTRIVLPLLLVLAVAVAAVAFCAGGAKAADSAAAQASQRSQCRHHYLLMKLLFQLHAFRK